MLARSLVRAQLSPQTKQNFVAVSGGADSLALAYAVHAEAAESAVAVIIDHQLQAGSAEVAAKARDTLRKIGYREVIIGTLEVEMIDGLEASARRARYAYFDQLLRQAPGSKFFLGHTLSDQAESVLLGLARGSGTKSLSGMARVNGDYIRPFLDLPRAITEEICAQQSLDFWQDPHNFDSTLKRSAIRHQLLPAMDEILGPKVEQALARTARILREDGDALDFYAAKYLTEFGDQALAIPNLLTLPIAVRARVLRAQIYAFGATAGAVTAEHLAPVEALVTDWHGQGSIDLPGNVKLRRISGRLSLSKSQPS
jgi:tRNA(Ile)-lysidine synthase